MTPCAPLSFLSDNSASVAPELLEAIAAANHRTGAYGDDGFSDRLDSVFSAFFETQVTVLPVISGTAANALLLAALCDPWGGIICHREAHIERDECGAPEFFTGGAKLVLAEGAAGRLTPESIAQALAPFQPMVHMVQPQVLSLTQSTELGTVYAPDAVAALATAAHARRLHVHMDGARFANALVHLGCQPADITWRAGVDALSFGATKNGALAAEAMVLFKPELAASLAFRRKRAGHLLSKQRYVAAQLCAYIESGQWQRGAARANRLAQKLAAAAPARLLYPVEANAVFLALRPVEADALRAKGAAFYDWGDAGSGHIRLVVSWDQDEAEVDALAEYLEALP